MYKDVTVIVPTLNEEKNIGKLITLINKLYSGIRIIVSDDGSKDKTKEISRKFSNVHFIDRAKKPIKGLTASAVDGILAAKTEYFVVIDGDLQHPPEKIKDVANALRKGNDIVVAIRVKVVDAWPWYRRIISKSATLMGNIRLWCQGVFCKDTLSGFFGMKTNVAREIIKKNPKSFQMQGYKVLYDMLKNMKMKRIASVPYVFGIRSGGTSKLSSRVMYYYLRSIFS